MKTTHIISAMLLIVCIGIQSLMGQQSEVRKLTPINPTKGEGFGLTTATDGNYIVATTLATRKLIIFERDRDHWIHLASLKGINNEVGIPASKGFGKSITINGNRIAVGVPESETDKDKSIGLVETFALLDGKWQLESIIRPPEPNANACFGKAVALNNNTALVGAPGYNYEEGQVFVFDNKNGNWTGKALEANLKPTFKFGTSVALMGQDMAIVGAPGFAVKRKEVGALLVYERKLMGNWELTQTIQGSGKLESLGSTIDLEGNLMAVGAYDAVAIYYLEGNEWTQVATIENPDAGETYSFASSVQLSPDGQRLLVSASDKVYLFSQNGGEWVLLNTFSDDMPMFGTSNAMGNDFFLINSPYAGANYMDGELYLHAVDSYPQNALLK